MFNFFILIASQGSFETIFETKNVLVWKRLERVLKKIGSRYEGWRRRKGHWGILYIFHIIWWHRCFQIENLRFIVDVCPNKTLKENTRYYFNVLWIYIKKGSGFYSPFNLLKFIKDVPSYKVFNFRRGHLSKFLLASPSILCKTISNIWKSFLLAWANQYFFKNPKNRLDLSDPPPLDFTSGLSEIQGV